MAARTIGAIALRPTGDTQGGYFFFSLTTGRVLNRGRWTSLPMPNEVIDRIHRMARQEHGNNGLLFEDWHHNPLIDPDDDGEDDSTYHPGEDEDNDDDDNDDGDNANPPEHPNKEKPIHPNPTDDQEERADETNDNATQAEPGHIEEGDNEEPGNDSQNENNPTNNDDEQMPVNPNREEAQIETNNGNPVDINDPALPPRARRELNRLANDSVGQIIYQGRTRSQTQQVEHNMITTGQLKPSTPIPYQHMMDFEKELFHRQIAGVCVPSEIGYEQNEVLRHTVLTQYTLKKGLQVFGPAGVEAVYKELLQLHDRKSR